IAAIHSSRGCPAQATGTVHERPHAIEAPRPNSQISVPIEVPSASPLLGITISRSNCLSRSSTQRSTVGRSVRYGGNAAGTDTCRQQTPVGAVIGRPAISKYADLEYPFDAASQVEVVGGASDAGGAAGQDVSVDHRRADVAMAQQRLDRPDVT